MTLNRWLAPRLLGLHTLAVVAIAGCVLMGLWQLGVYGSRHEDVAKVARTAVPVDLLRVWGPDDPFRADLVDRRVRIEGQVSGAPFIVKRPDGQKWFAQTVRVDGTRSSIIVVMGHFTDLVDWQQPPPPWTAILQPPEDSGDLSIAQRVNTTKGDLFSGYALLDDPARGLQLKPVEPPDPHVSWTVGLRNLAYALQWWVFGLFAGFMWWRMASDLVDVEGRLKAAG